MTARKPVHPHLSPNPNVTFLENSNIESDSEDLEESINVPGSPKKQATPEVDRKEKEQRSPNKPAKEEKIVPKRQSILWLYVAILLVIIGIVFLWPQPTLKSCSFDKLKTQTPRQSEFVWKALTVGIENLLNKKHVTPNVYLFLYQDPRLKKLTDDIAKETAKCFGNQGVIEMRSEDFTGGDDYGYAINMYKQKIKDGKVLVIINLNKIPAKAARALHAICDTENPIANDVVIFLTLNPSTKQVNPNTNSVQLAVDTLHALWGDHLRSNELDPLITRVTDQVLYLNP